MDPTSKNEKKEVNDGLLFFVHKVEQRKVLLVPSRKKPIVDMPPDVMPAVVCC